MAEYKPGEWWVEEVRAESISGSSYVHDIVVQPIGIHFDPDTVDGFRNAYLTAAAPKLLEALEMAVTRPQTPALLEYLASVIAKAKGESTD